MQVVRIAGVREYGRCDFVGLQVPPAQGQPELRVPVHGVLIVAMRHQLVVSAVDYGVPVMGIAHDHVLDVDQPHLVSRFRDRLLDFFGQRRRNQRQAWQRNV